MLERLPLPCVSAILRLDFYPSLPQCGRSSVEVRWLLRVIPDTSSLVHPSKFLSDYVHFCH
jgi:hypothetical protein